MTAHEQTTVNCYTFFDKVFPACGMLDYTEGMYHGDPQTPYEVAQRNQIEWILDQAGCRAGTRLLEIGCGNGNLLAAAGERGTHATGITISPEQVALCRGRGLHALRLDYRDIDAAWDGHFDAVIANGPIEHFVQPADAAAGQDDAIYRRMFEIVHRVLDSVSPVRRFVNTTIHFVERPQPGELQRSPWRLPRNSAAAHWAWLERSFGGFYPVVGQFERCAQGLFRLIDTVDGTEDYRLTSEAWLVRVQQELSSVQGLARTGLRSLPFFVRHPQQAAEMLYCMLVSQSWNWQFRGEHPPTRLLRQTWEFA